MYAPGQASISTGRFCVTPKSNSAAAYIQHERTEDRFPRTLDSLMIWVKTDSATVADWDSLYGLNPDSMLFSPRTGNRFLYTLNDTGRVAIYLLKDPDSADQIGSTNPDDITTLNASSWE